MHDIGARSEGGQTVLQVALLSDAPMALPLCEETTALMRAATLPWRIGTHRMWPRSFRTRGVFSMLCVAKFGEGRAALPKDLLLHVLGFCGRQWFTQLPHDNAAAIAV